MLDLPKIVALFFMSIGRWWPVLLLYQFGPSKLKADPRQAVISGSDERGGVSLMPLPLHRGVEHRETQWVVLESALHPEPLGSFPGARGSGSKEMRSHFGRELEDANARATDVAGDRLEAVSTHQSLESVGSVATRLGEREDVGNRPRKRVALLRAGFRWRGGALALPVRVRSSGSCFFRIRVAGAV